MAQDEMIQNVVSMARKLNGDISQPFLQRLELARQLESLSKIQDEHILSTAKWLVNQGLVLLGISTLREIARFGWIVYRYPVLGRVELSWSEAAIMLPAVQDLLDKKIERNEPLPDNIIRAQQSRFNAPYLRISLEFPNTPPGDGDGLCELRVQELHGLFVNDKK